MSYCNLLVEVYIFIFHRLHRSDESDDGFCLPRFRLLTPKRTESKRQPEGNCLPNGQALKLLTTYSHRSYRSPSLEKWILNLEVSVGDFFFGAVLVSTVNQSVLVASCLDQS